MTENNRYEPIQKVSIIISRGSLDGVWMLPGMSAFATSKMKQEIEKLDIPPVGEFLEMIHDAGGRILACKATVEMFHLTKSDFCDQVDDIVSVGQMYEASAGAQIIFT